jgi:hypothetical protein
MRLHPGCLIPFTALLLLPLQGCLGVAAGAGLGAAVGAATTPRAPDASQWQAGEALTVDFSAPRELVADMPGRGERLRLHDVTRVLGRVQRAYGDTLLLAISEVRRSRGAPLAFARLREPVALLQVDAGTRVTVLTTRSPVARSLMGAGAGFVVAVVLSFVAIVILCRAGSCAG